jgi:hypothetical protein
VQIFAKGRRNTAGVHWAITYRQRIRMGFCLLRYLYEKGSLAALGKERKKGFEIGSVDRFRYRTRYFSDSGIIGTKAFVNRHYQVFKDLFSAKHEKRPKPITGLEGIFSLKRLSERI